MLSPLVTRISEISFEEFYRGVTSNLEQSTFHRDHRAVGYALRASTRRTRFQAALGRAYASGLRRNVAAMKIPFEKESRQVLLYFFS